ncbi:ferritin-like domain-containing protein [Bradyrhizobium monzae]|uniref:ferritin-like domain-containing protein n=1 Tax=Bradyrhizobium sp. Oc8 TaxID=2876780 RepID=UPI001F39398C|nr:ferritin family protein [Bradyrhizobium sp. Oc8]
MLLSRTLLLKDQPKGTLHSLGELFALADAMEREAALKYDELAGAMREQGRQDLAGVFAELAAAEREHVGSVARWSQSRLGKLPDPALVRWQAPETFDAEATDEIKASRLITPYQALAMAVQNEERAFAFWAYMAAFADDDDIKTAAEAMAREELGHVATLRRERRRAYHREHPRSSDGATLRPAGVGKDRVDARTLELRLATQLDALEHHPWGAAGNRLRELREETLGMSEEAAGIGSFPTAFAAHDAQAIAEALADTYLEEAENAGDQERVDLLQRMAMKAIARLAWLRSIG